MSSDTRASNDQTSHHEENGPAIQDAASLVIVRFNRPDRPQVLMGRRHADAVFLPNKYVFPGGRFEDSDATTPTVGALSDRDQALLMQSVANDRTPHELNALAVTAIRETFEETGRLISDPERKASTERQQGDAPTALSDWSTACAEGYLPNLSALNLFARAVTPPGRPRRYDTRFFWASANDLILDTAPIDSELSEIGWIDLADIESLDLPRITRVIANDFLRVMSQDLEQPPPATIPFYVYRNDRFEHVLLSHQGGCA